ncbi:hypothetical protein Acr_07g0008630 [Actinidia rufa]|uniref:Uncharacterized protein n=1 Tax=Actinidia rufa TaxID=165716 RepID=A0A7J0EWS8_9ERIC|nr:hypothetical protein Acr_07g0008630 [Actinidia rufa]
MAVASCDSSRCLQQSFTTSFTASPKRRRSGKKIKTPTPLPSFPVSPLLLHKQPSSPEATTIAVVPAVEARVARVRWILQALGQFWRLLRLVSLTFCSFPVPQLGFPIVEFCRSICELCGFCKKCLLMHTRYMERTNSLSRGKRSLEGGDDQPERKRPALAR